MLELYVIYKQWQGRQLLIIYDVQTLLGFICIFASFLNKGKCNYLVVVVSNALYLLVVDERLFNAILNVYTISQLNDRCSKLLF